MNRLCRNAERFFYVCNLSKDINVAIKFIIDSLAEVPEGLRSEYEEKDGKYYLKVDGLEDTDELKRTKSEEEAKRKEAERKLREAEERESELKSKLEDGQRDKDRESGDIEALEKSWKEKFEKRETELTGEVDRLKGTMRNGKLNGEANKLAATLGGDSAEVLLPHIKSRLDVAEKDGELVLTIKDKEGKASAMSIDELKQEFTDNNAFSGVIVGSKASGGGAGRGGSGGGSGDERKTTSATQNYLAQINGE